MKKTVFSVFAGFCFLWAFLTPALSSDWHYLEQEPFIQIKEAKYEFPTVFEGEVLSHTFKVINYGPQDLVIESIRHS